MSHEGNDKVTDNQRDELLEGFPPEWSSLPDCEVCGLIHLDDVECDQELKVIEVHHFEMDGKPASLTITEPPKNVADLATVIELDQ